MSDISTGSAASGLDGGTRGMVGAVTGKVKNAGSSAAHFVRDQYQHLSEGAHHAYDAGKDSAKRLERSAEDCVKSHPMSAILAAIGFGILLGALWKRKD